MALKTFNVDDAVYKNYSKHCKKNGISMSKQIEIFLRNEIEKLKTGSEKVDVNMKKMENDFGSGLIKEHPLRKYC